MERFLINMYSISATNIFRYNSFENNIIVVNSILNKMIFVIILCSIASIHSLRMSLYDSPPKVWSFLSDNLKSNAREWFIGRAENAGIPWKATTSLYNEDYTFQHLKHVKKELEDSSIIYPNYFLQSFHGYEDGNLEWKAAMEGEVATYSVSVGYWTDTNYAVAEKWMRYNASENINHYLKSQNIQHTNINYVLDLGCSMGISSEHLHRQFIHANIIGLDLSPYFLAVAKYRSDRDGQNIHYIHANAEQIPMIDESLDMVAINFMLHEVPYTPRINILQEAYRVLKPNGVLVVLDIEPQKIIKNFAFNQFRRWAFEVTEPHIYEYYQHDMIDSIVQTGFDHVENYQNDPMNTLWIGKKSVLKVQPLRPALTNPIFAYS